jgi:hypothetical protein
MGIAGLAGSVSRRSSEGRWDWWEAPSKGSQCHYIVIEGSRVQADFFEKFLQNWREFMANAAFLGWKRGCRGFFGDFSR